jgi:hypothetical protein
MRKLSDSTESLAKLTHPEDITPMPLLATS